MILSMLTYIATMDGAYHYALFHHKLLSVIVKSRKLRVLVVPSNPMVILSMGELY